MSEPTRQGAIGEAKASGWKFNPNDNEWQKPDSPSKKHAKNTKKKEMARKMTFHPHSLVGKLASLVKESESLRKYPMGAKKKKKTPSWFTKNYGGGADLPPGRIDRDNE